MNRPSDHCPSHHRLRRALARAERGTALSLDETTALMGARGEHLDRLLAIAARLRDLGHGDVVTYSPQGLRTPDDAVPRPLPLLHVREAARQARRAVPHARARPSRSRGPAPRPAARKRCSPSATGRRIATRSRGPGCTRRIRLDARLRARRRDPRHRGDGAAAPPEPRRDELRGDRAAQARQRVDGHHARDLERPASARRGNRTSAHRTRCRPCGLRTIEDAGRLAVPFTTGILVGIGETDAGAGRGAVRRSGTCIGGTATCRRSSCRTSARSPRTAMHGVA